MLFNQGKKYVNNFNKVNRQLNKKNALIQQQTVKLLFSISYPGHFSFLINLTAVGRSVIMTQGSRDAWDEVVLSYKNPALYLRRLFLKCMVH